MENLIDINKKLSSLFEERKIIEKKLNYFVDLEIQSLHDYQNEIHENDADISEELSLTNYLNKVNEKIHFFQRQAFEIEKNSYFINNKNRFVKGTSISDLKTSQDSINRKFYAKVLSDYISSDNSEKVNLGIFGKWGQGKSSFLELIKTELIKVEGVKVISYDASIYSEKEEIWIQIVKILFDYFEKEKKCNKIKYLKKKFKLSFKDQLINYLVKGTLIFVAIIITVLNRKEFLPLYGSFFDFKNFSISQIYSYSIFLYTLVAGIIPIFLKTKKYWDKFSTFLIKTDLHKTFNDLNHIKCKLIKEYEIIEEIWLNKNERIYIIVDELDRLNASQIVNFFDALQIFIDLEKISFVFSIDYKTVCCALADNHLYQIEDASISNKIKFGMKYFIMFT